MNSYAYRVSLALTALAVLGLALPGRAQQTSQSSTNLIPLQLTYVTAGDPLTIPVNPPVRVVRLTLTSGQSDLLGPFTGIGQHVTHFSADGKPFYVTDGVAVITAASGDSLFFSYMGLVHPGTAPNALSVEEAVTITGGTGRFVGATGSGVVSEMTDLSKKQGIDTFEGMIS